MTRHRPSCSRRALAPWHSGMTLAGDQAQSLDAAFVEKARKLRPFYFIVVVWGERYTDLLLNFCVASLLSPNNIPALLNSGNKFLIATTDEDWARMQERPIFKKLKHYVEPVFFRIPPCPPGLSHCTHMGIGHKLATHRAYEDRAYGAILTPDILLSDGTVAAMQRHAVNGVEVVLTAALRFGEEPLFEHLKQLGIASIDSRFADEARPLVATGRQLVWAGLRSFHSETLRYEWEKPCFHTFPSGIWWRVDDDGVIVHCLSWAPMLIDYNAMREHDSTVMDNWTIDGDYIYRNFGLTGKVHVVQDSDEMMHISWAPLSDREQSLEPASKHYLNPIWGEWMKGAVLHDAISNPIFDPLKRKILPLPVYWHAGDIDQRKWQRTESKAMTILIRYGGVRLKDLAALYPAGAGIGARLLFGSKGLGRHILFAWNWRGYVIRPISLASWYLGRVVDFAVRYWAKRHHVFGLAKRALYGDPDAKRRVKNAVRNVTLLLMGKSPN